MTGRHLQLLKYLGWYDESFFLPQKQDVKVSKVKLPLCLLKQLNMEDYVEVKCVLKNGHTNVVICWDVFSSMMCVISTSLNSCLC
jgi:hypothetical protein